ncbi:DMT family transporter [Gluconacetobacter sacchari]|uniref:DMT family transporter n=1 Tax=Gluconacetobacter sacchari TaxID=92759 RepID=UPI0039B65FA8
MTAYLYLAMAIIAEVFATSFLKYTDQFTRLVPTLLTFGGYGVAFFFLSLVLRAMPTGVAYAIWSGAGIVLISAINWMWLKQRLDAAALVGIALILLGVVIINLFSRTAGH